MQYFARPIVIVSRCLEFDHCRYNGDVISSKLVRLLMPLVDFKPVCPEVEIGLGAPRDPVRIVEIDGNLHLYQPATGRDITEEMLTFSAGYLRHAAPVDGFILKNRSPSCGIKDVKVYPSKGKAAAKKAASGIFAGEVLKAFSGLPIDDEARVSNYDIREHFLTRLFAMASFREAKQAGRIKELIDFHSRNKLLIMAYSQKELKSLGKIVANHDDRAFEDLIMQYESGLKAALQRPPRSGGVVNVLMHAFGYFKQGLTHKEKAYFLDLLDDYRNRKIPLSSIQTVLSSWIVRFEVGYLENQTFFNPFPEELLDVSDSGKGRSL